jgi:hypothetical protein
MTADASQSLGRRLVAEGLGTAMLLAAVVGSGIMGDRLSGGNVAIALLANAVATGAALVALILTFGPLSGAHFNPAVSFADASQGGLSWRDSGAYALVWGIHDPATVEGSKEEKEKAFNTAFRELDARIKILTSLRLESLDQLSLQRQLDAIGQARQETQLK